MTAPHYEDARAQLWHGEALAVLAQLDTGSADALITDPPYSSGGMTRGDRTDNVHAKYVQTDSKGGHDLVAFGGDNRDGRSYAYWCALWLNECRRIVRPGGVFLAFTDWRQLPSTTDAVQAGGWVWRGVVPWVKPTARPQAGRFTSQCEYVVWGSNGPLPADYSDAPLPGFYQAAPPRDRDHITQKPVDVMRQLVRIVPPGGTVLDPFMGSGTTGVACMIEGRRFVGVEEVLHFADVSARRIREAQGQPIDKGDQGALDLTAGGAA